MKSISNLKSKQKSGQAAMEFLMTYGWALLVVLIAIAALAYFGLLNPSKFLPDKVTIAPGLTVSQASIDENTVVLAVGNGLGDTLRDFVITLDDCNGETASSIIYSRFKAGDTKLIAIPCDTTQFTNSKFKSDLVVDYTTKKLNHELTHSKKGELNWQAQLGTDVVVESVDKERNELIQSLDGSGQVYDSDYPIVINTTNGHIWQAADSSDTMIGTFTLNWSNAILYCQNLKMCGDGSMSGNHTTVGDCSSNDGDLFTNWRLPTGDDTNSKGYDLDPYDPENDNLENYFNDLNGFNSTYHYYWTATAHPSDPDPAYYMYLVSGHVDFNDKDTGYDYRARCVRDQ